MSVEACAAIVERCDPNRFLATMATPPHVRVILFPLYAFNVEIVRAPWVTHETEIAEIRLQWWRDVLAEIANNQPVRRHEVATSLASVISPKLTSELDALVLARRWDIYKRPFPDQAAFHDYLNATSGNLLWVAVQSIGEADEKIVRDVGYSQGLANWFRAIPELDARGRHPLVDRSPDALRDLAQQGLDRLRRARRLRTRIRRRVRSILLVAWESGTILRQVMRNPRVVYHGCLGQSPAQKRLELMLRSVTGRW